MPDARQRRRRRGAPWRWRRRVAPDELLVVLLSGGASALMALPGRRRDARGQAGRRCGGCSRRGADIHELNTVRKHLSAIKGGRLAAACAGRTSDAGGLGRRRRRPRRSSHRARRCPIRARSPTRWRCWHAAAATPRFRRRSCARLRARRARATAGDAEAPAIRAWRAPTAASSAAQRGAIDGARQAAASRGYARARRRPSRSPARRATRRVAHVGAWRRVPPRRCRARRA